MYTGCIAGNAEEAIMKEGITLCCPCHGGKYDEFGINVRTTGCFQNVDPRQ